MIRERLTRFEVSRAKHPGPNDLHVTCLKLYIHIARELGGIVSLCVRGRGPMSQC